MKELVVMSGKGGTGKTSLTASFAVLAKNFVLADTDVDAADLHLILQPAVRQKKSFTAAIWPSFAPTPAQAAPMPRVVPLRGHRAGNPRHGWALHLHRG